MGKQIMFFALAILMAGCCVLPKKAGEKMPAGQETTTQPQGTATPKEMTTALQGGEIPEVKPPEGTQFEPAITAEIQPVYFDFDSYALKPAAQATLKKTAQYLLANPAILVVLEGNCDERGTEEYNLVLGEQRSLSARRFLIGLGVDPKRLNTISYGKDRPLDPGHNEEAWAKNRRVDFSVSKQ